VLDPGVIVVEEGGTEEVFVRLVDQQGTSLPTEFSVSAAGSQVTVTADRCTGRSTPRTARS
jgi:hypothetical protein